MAKKSVEKTNIDLAMDDAYEELRKHTPGSAEHVAVLATLMRLNSIKQSGMDKRERVSANTWATIVASTVQVGMVLVFEMRNVWTTKSVPFMTKTK